LFGHAGQVTYAVDTNVVARLQGSREHVVVVFERLLMTAAIWGFALLGVLGRTRRGHADLTYALLAIAPFPLLLMQSYGGEILLRIYLFPLPPMLFFVASVFGNTTPGAMSARSATSLLLVSLALFAGFLVARYGNERMDHFTSQELDAVNEFYRITPRDG